MANDKIVTLKVKQKDKESMNKLSCAEYGMKQYEVFEIMLSFCLGENKRLEEWKNKRKKTK